MSNQNQGEGPNQTGEGTGDNLPTIEELQAKLAEQTKLLETEKQSKERILEESKKYKATAKSYEAEQAEIAAKAKEAEEAKLREKGQYDVILQQREARIKELEETETNLKGELGSRDSAIINFRKAGAFEALLGGKLKHQDYWNHVDFDTIAVNPETGKIDEESLRSSVADFSKNFKELIDFGAGGNLPNTTAARKGKLTYEEWKKLPLIERKKRIGDVNLK